MTLHLPPGQTQKSGEVRENVTVLGSSPLSLERVFDLER